MNPDEDFIGKLIGLLFVALCATGLYWLAVQLSLAIPTLETLTKVSP